MRKSRINFRTLLLNFLLFAVVFTVLLVWNVRRRTNAKKAEASLVAEQVSENILSRVDDIADREGVLKAWLNLLGDEGKQEIASDQSGELILQEFNQMAGALYDERYLYSVQLLPDGVVRYVYPFEENQSILEKDALNSKEEGELLAESAKSGEMVITGPEYISHIGLCLNFRTPVYYDNNELWGFTSIAMNLPEALKPLSLDRLQELGYDYELRCISSDGDNERIAGSFNSIRDGITKEFNVQSIQWKLTVRPTDGWLSVGRIVLIFLGILLVSLLIALLLSFIKSNRENKMESLQSDAKHDQMTGLLNHEASVKAIQTELDLMEGGVLLIIDIDDFKQVNDTAGHLAGDKVLEQVAAALRTTFRRNDILGRYGGDEFVVYMIGYISIPDFSVKASQFQRKIRKIPIGSTDRCITCSIGVARRCDDTPTAEELIRRADRALYDSKESGKDRFTIFDDSASTVVVGSKEVEGEEKKEFTIHE